MKWFEGVPVKELIKHIPVIGGAVADCLPQLKKQETVESLPNGLILSGLKDYFHLNEAEARQLDEAVAKAGERMQEIVRAEIAEFGVEVDEEDLCHKWSNEDRAVQEACVSAIEEKYRGRTGEIVFYGPSNIQMWYSLEKDMLPYKAQNHGMGGCIDPEMIAFAPRMLYAFRPSVVFFQTGSNDLANGLSLEQILQNKKEMYGLYLEHMPDTKLVVMSGLPLPNRQEFWADTVKTNNLLKQMCEQTERMYFMDATDAMLSETGPENMKTGTGDGRYFTPEYFRADGIHLNKKGHDVWTARIKQILSEILDNY